MKINVQYVTLGQNFRAVLQLAALLVIVLAIGSPCRAQSGIPSNAAQAARPGMSATPAAGTAVAQAAPLPEIAPRADMAKPPAKAGQEGIKVHGHWIIDIRNSDGTLDKHLDFENGLCTLAYSSAFSGGSGDTTLAGLISGQLVPGPWQIILNSPVIPAGGSPGPACGTVSPTSNQFLLNQSNATTLDTLCNASGHCFPVLAPPSLTASQSGVILAGQFTIPPGISNTTITAVQANLGVCTFPGYSGPSTCLAGDNQVFPFSGTYLTGIGAVPAAPTVTAGQTVAVSLQYSFQ